LVTGEWLWTAREILIVTKAFICPTNVHVNWFKLLKFVLKITINAPTCFGLTKPSSGSLRCVLR